METGACGLWSEQPTTSPYLSLEFLSPAIDLFCFTFGRHAPSSLPPVPVGHSLSGRFRFIREKTSVNLCEKVCEHGLDGAVSFDGTIIIRSVKAHTLHR